MRNMYSKICVKQPLSKRQQIVFKTNYRLMQVKSNAECSMGSILHYFRTSLSYYFSLDMFLKGYTLEAKTATKNWN